MKAERIGKRLRALRGMEKQSTVARGCGCTQSAIAMYETGKRVPTDAMKRALARYYGVRIEEVFYEEEEEENDTVQEIQ